MDKSLPETGPQAHEPARIIAQAFADKVMIRTVISAIFGLLAAVLKFTVAEDMIDNLVTIVMFASLVITPLIANHEQSSLAKGQGEKTRNAVYAPATVVKIRDEAYAAGVPPVEPKPDLPPPAGDN